MRTTLILWFLFFFLSSSSVAETRIEIVKLGNFSDAQKRRVELIVSNLEKVINSREFLDQVINHRVNGELRYENNNNQTNNEIYSKIMSGQELLDTSVDNKWTLSLNLKWFFTINTLAYTYFDKPEIFINSRYYNRGMDAQIAGTICHEYMHKVGYSHDKKSTNTRPFSVPYAVGDICEMLYINNIGGFVPQEVSCNVWCRVKRLINGRDK